MAYCTKCGSELIEGDRFCRTCGALIDGQIEPSEQASVSKCDTGAVDRYSQPTMTRFDKCPACGEPLTLDTKVCPACDYPIAKLMASGVVCEFVTKLGEIEAQASGGPATYKAVVEEIGRAEIPQTANGALAFLFVAEGRVSTSIRDYGQGLEARKAVRQAWTAKARQVYDIAKLSFSEEAEFAQIESTYQRVNAAAGVKGAIDGFATANESLLSKGCVGRIVWLFIAMMLLGLVLNIFSAVRSHLSLILIVAVVLFAGYYFKKNSNSK